MRLTKKRADCARGGSMCRLYMTALGEREVVAESISMQNYARVGDPVISDLRLYSTLSATATMQILVDGQASSSRVILLQTRRRIIFRLSRRQDPKGSTAWRFRSAREWLQHLWRITVFTPGWWLGGPAGAGAARAG